MSEKTRSTRRAFLKGGALAAAPLAAAAAGAAAKSEHEATIDRLQAEAAIRDLHQAWLRKVNTGLQASELFADPKRARLPEAVTRVDADHQGAADEIRLAADGLHASGRYACMVETETELARDCTLAQMRHAQGEGRLRQSERRLLKADYVKTEAGWAIARLGFEPV
jgi:tellurite resistance protein